MTFEEFKKLMQTVADGWNEGDAKKAADCFAEDSIYSQPPDTQFIKGRKALFEYFGGKNSQPDVMKMVWHNLFFDEAKQVGAGEFTFEMSNKNHGVVVVKIEKGGIKNWREYQWTGNLDFNTFVRDNKF